jgi:hypothetical protein
MTWLWWATRPVRSSIVRNIAGVTALSNKYKAEMTVYNKAGVWLNLELSSARGCGGSG